jgi:hypothetical protein
LLANSYPRQNCALHSVWCLYSRVFAWQTRSRHCHHRTLEPMSVDRPIQDCTLATYAQTARDAQVRAHLRSANESIPFLFFLPTALESPSTSFVLIVLVCASTRFFFTGGSFSSTLSPLSRALRRLGAPAPFMPFIPIGSSGERVRIMDIAPVEVRRGVVFRLSDADLWSRAVSLR